MTTAANVDGTVPGTKYTRLNVYNLQVPGVGVSLRRETPTPTPHHHTSIGVTPEWVRGTFSQQTPRFCALRGAIYASMGDTAELVNRIRPAA